MSASGVLINRMSEIDERMVAVFTISLYVSALFLNMRNN